MLSNANKDAHTHTYMIVMIVMIDMIVMIVMMMMMTTMMITTTAAMVLKWVDVDFFTAQNFSPLRFPQFEPPRSFLSPSSLSSWSWRWAKPRSFRCPASQSLGPVLNLMFTWGWLGSTGLVVSNDVFFRCFCSPILGGHEPKPNMFWSRCFGF